MLHIAICDDEREICHYIEKKIAEFCGKYSIQIVTKSFQKVETLLNQREKIHFDAFFLDIELDSGINGIDLSRQLFCGEPNCLGCDVVFMTGKEGYEKRLLESPMLYFLQKPFKDDKIESLLKCISGSVRNSQRLFTFPQGKEVYPLPVMDIVYFETRLRKIVIHTVNERYEFYGTLDQAAESLKGQVFFRCHQSYLVNTAHIRRIRFDSILLCDGGFVPISYSRRKYVHEALANICFDEMDMKEL